MTDQDYIELERLLAKLTIHLNHRYCIVPEVVQDAFHIAIYDNNGEKKKEAIGATLRETVEKITPNT